MNGYHIALFIHLLAIIAASVAAGLVHFADGRCRRATSMDEALQWRDLVDVVSKVFPGAVVTLFVTGVFMIYQARWMWSTGWIVAGLIGAVALAGVGRFLGHLGAVSRREIVRAGEAGRPIPAPPVLDSALSWGNTGLALAIVFVMVAKPALPGALLLLAVGMTAGAGIGVRSSRPQQRVGRAER